MIKGLFFLTVVVFSASLAEAWSKGDELVEKILANYEEQMKGIKDITIITDMYTRYQKRAKVDGKVIYKTRTETEVMGKKFIHIYDGVYEWKLNPVSGEVEKEEVDYNPYGMIENLKAADVEYEGTEQLDDYTAYVFKIKDIAKLIGTAKSEGMTEGKVSGKVWVDVKKLVMEKISIDAEIVDEEAGEKEEVRPQAVKITIRLEDYRKVDGMLIPYRTVMTMGEGLTPEISPEEKQEMQESLVEMEKELEKMSPEQRATAEKLMRPQIEMLRKGLSGSGIETVIEVKEVKVNVGLSDNLFDGSKLK